MRLIIIAEENVYEHEVDPSMEVQDVLALLEAEVSLPSTHVWSRMLCITPTSPVLAELSDRLTKRLDPPQHRLRRRPQHA